MILKSLTGTVQSFQAISRTQVHIQLDTQNGMRTVRLQLTEPWMLQKNDHLHICGTEDPKTGFFLGYGYQNNTKSIQSIPSYDWGTRFFALFLSCFLGVFMIGLGTFLFSSLTGYSSPHWGMSAILGFAFLIPSFLFIRLHLHLYRLRNICRYAKKAFSPPAT